MSTTSSNDPTTTYQSSASTSTNPVQDNDGLTSSASLYLYTFLATLILLLSVSGAIVVRSYLMRRRQRIMIEEAIRNGTYIPPARYPRPLGAKPVLHDVYLRFDTATDEKGGAAGPSYGGRSWWQWMMPVAATLWSTGAPSLQTKPERAPMMGPLPWYLHSPWRRHRLQSQTSLPRVSSAIALQSPAELSSEETVNLTVLIAMPAPHQVSDKLDEGTLPHIEFGIAQVPLKKRDGALS
ncbi:hypothetical protein BKA93DRAFT_804573 [Sparassis latifolia]